uniref:Uncharacterized protein n=1 Tax=Opuntia streptacantha TaxID=393608 RepID=A0A7C9CN65_OPUST
MSFPTAFTQRNPVGKSEEEKISFPLNTLVVGTFSTIHPLLSIAGDIPTKCSSVGKFFSVTETVGNFPLLSIQWEIFYRTNVLANQGEISFDHQCSEKFPTAPVSGKSMKILQHELRNHHKKEKCQALVKWLKN